MSLHLSIPNVGDPNDITTTFTALAWIENVDDQPLPRDGTASATVGLYRSAAANEPGGDRVSVPITVFAGDTVETDQNGNTIRVLKSDWLNASGDVTATLVFDSIKTLTLFCQEIMKR